MPAPPPAGTLDASPYLVAWLKDRVPALGGRVYPHLAGPNEPSPYCTYSRVDRVVHGDQQGPDGLVSSTFEVDCWGRSRSQLEAVVGRVVGTPDAPGLVGFRGLLEPSPGTPRPAGAAPDRLFVQCVTAPDDFEAYERPAAAQPAGWVRQSVRLTLHHETLPR